MPMTLRDLVSNIENYSGVTADSKEVKKNFVFVAVRGKTLDGRQFIPQALRRGAAAIVSSGNNGLSERDGVRIVKAGDTRKALAELCAAFHGHPGNKVNVVAVTGTNGKTTVTYLIEAILKYAGMAPAVIGTVNFRIGASVMPACNTTPGPETLNKILARAAREDVRYAVMEVSSHAIDQCRIGAIDLHSAVFTNLTHDHLDYHKSMERYYLAKEKLFKGLGRRAYAVINLDDQRAKRLVRSCKAPVITYGIKNSSMFMAKGLSCDVGGTSFTMRIGKESVPLRTPLIGRHNVCNILAACAWAHRAGIGLDTVKSALEEFRGVPGRLERVDCKRGYSVFVDYAHTEDALKNILSALKGLARGRVIAVFGCGGQRDRLKRPKMGAAATRLADYAIITSDNPRDEDPRRIIRDICRGINKNNYCVIPERREAIKKSLMLARSGDIVLVAGKGHEDYQLIKGRKSHFNDREAVSQCLNSMN